MITTTVLEIKKDSLDKTVKLIPAIRGVEVQKIDKENSRVLVSIESDDKETLTDISKKLEEVDGVILVNHHSFYFGEDQE